MKPSRELWTSTRSGHVGGWQLEGLLALGAGIARLILTVSAGYVNTLLPAPPPPAAYYRNSGCSLEIVMDRESIKEWCSWGHTEGRTQDRGQMWQDPFTMEMLRRAARGYCEQTNGHVNHRKATYFYAPTDLKILYCLNYFTVNFFWCTVLWLFIHTQNCVTTTRIKI